MSDIITRMSDIIKCIAIDDEPLALDIINREILPKNRQYRTQEVLKSDTRIGRNTPVTAGYSFS